MRVFDRIEASTIERRDWQLWLLALAVILVLSGGVALLMYPAVFSQPLTMTGSTLHRVFFAFCLLCFLLVGYLMDRHIVIRRLRRQLAEELRTRVTLLEQASADLLENLPGVDHFQDRLAMEIRRAATMEQPLSVLIVGLKPSHDIEVTGGASTAYGDAAKAVIRRLRREDSIYIFRRGIFGIVLPGLSTSDAGSVSDRIEEGLTDASGVSNRFSFEIRSFNFPEHAKTTHELEKMAILCFPEEWPGPEPAGADEAQPRPSAQVKRREVPGL
jgi:GGDEF domain-containing protein